MITLSDLDKVGAILTHRECDTERIIPISQVYDDLKSKNDSVVRNVLDLEAC